MAIAKMNLAKFSGKADMLDKLIWDCLADGNFHPEQASQYISASMGYVPFYEENLYKQPLQEIKELASSIGYELDDSATERNLVLDEESSGLLSEVKDDLKALADEKQLLIDQKTRCENGITVFSHYIDLDINLDKLLESEFIQVRFGRMPLESYEKFVSSEAIQSNPYVMFIPSSHDEQFYWGVYFTPKDKKEEIDRIFAGLYFERFKVPGAAGTPKDIIEHLKESIDILTKQIEEIDRRTKELLDENMQELDILYSTLLVRNEIYEMKKNVVVNGEYFFCVGWVTRASAKALKEKVEKLDGISMELWKPEEDTTNTPPTKLKNLKIARPFEFFIDMYGLPGYHDVDVTSFVAVTYTIIFGLMFGDIGQGFVLSIAGYLMWKLKKMALGKALIPCGISSMIFGFVFGSVFGYEHLLDPVYHALGWKGKPLEVMDSINTVLLIAIGIGVGLVCVAILINIYACIKRKHFGEAIFSQNGIVGLIFYLSAACFAFNFMSGQTLVANSTLGILLAVGAVLLMIKEIPIGIIDKHPDWKPESIGDFVAQNVFELLEYVLSYASNTVSFLRVGAFVLVHAGMMMVVFSLAGESENIFVIILGNILVIALEGLLTGIQVLRLEFYEMFSRFYEGNGRPFNAIKINKNK